MERNFYDFDVCVPKCKFDGRYHVSDLCLIVLRNGDELIGFYNIENDGWEITTGGYIWGSGVARWMPLPEPLQEKI